MNYKDTKPYVSAFLSVDLLTDFVAFCFTDFIDWRYIHSCARIYRPSFHENKPKTLVFTNRKTSVLAGFRENRVYNFGHWFVFLTQLVNCCPLGRRNYSLLVYCCPSTVLSL
jgi:hypothetical protein